MGDTDDKYPDGFEPEQVFPHGTAGHHDPRWRGDAWPALLLGASASVVIVAVIVLLNIGDRFDENGDPVSASIAANWVCAAALVLVQVAVLVRAIYVRSRVSTVVALAALSFACWLVWGLATR
jgi:hypothetical protein